MCISTQITGTKAISIRNDTYELLKNTKREGKVSATLLIVDRLLKEKRNLSAYFGSLENKDLLEGLEEDPRKLRDFRDSGYYRIDPSALLDFLGV